MTQKIGQRTARTRSEEYGIKKMGQRGATAREDGKKERKTHNRSGGVETREDDTALQLAKPSSDQR